MRGALIAAAAGGAIAAIVYYKLISKRGVPVSIVDDIAMLECKGRPFAPPTPTAAQLIAGETDAGGILRVGSLVLQRAQFKALWIRIGCQQMRSPAPALLAGVVQSAIQVQSKVKPVKAAVYVGISEGCLAAGDAVDLDILYSAGFVFHHYRPGEAAVAGEYVYVADLAKMVPCYATSIEGATGVVLSPDERNVLVVWERGGWNTPGGAIDQGEMKVDGLKREIREEVGVTIDENVAPYYLGGYQAARARDNRINDNFSVFAVRAASDHFEIDNKEIHDARWMPWRTLLDAWIAAGKPAADRNVELSSSVLPEGKKLVGRNLLRWLEVYKTDKGMTCKITPGKECKIGG